MRDDIIHYFLDARKAKRRGRDEIARQQGVRLQDMVTHARTNSPFYRALYRDVPERIGSHAQLPVTDKKSLMSEFDAWVTDREVEIQALRAFIGRAENIGETFRGKYTVATTSGTTGERGIFLMDRRSLAVTSVLALRMLGSWLGLSGMLRVAARGGRMAMVMAAGGHFASAVAAARLQRSGGWRAHRIKALSADMPMEELVCALNAFQPAVIAPYASMAALLADEQEAGRLNISPVLLALAAEGLPDAEYRRIARVFRAKVGNSYAATECPYLSYACDEGWLHVNTDWVVFEPVDEGYKPVAPGNDAHTVLIGNLANKVQPVLRYDLGDSVVQRADACPCGNPFPAIRVQGRSAEVMKFPVQDGKPFAIPPLAFGIAMDGLSGIELFQIVQSEPARLRLRLKTAPGVNADTVFENAKTAITRVLTKHGLEHVAVDRAPEPPEKSGGGKLKRLIPFSSAAPHV